MPLSDLLENLAAFDTPTICNALEMIDPNRRNFGYTTKSFFLVNPQAMPVVGLARTSTCRSLRPSDKSRDDLKAERIEYYRYVSEGTEPKIAVMQDLDGSESGRGPFWGEFNARVHVALGCKGVVTDGSIRDVKNLPSNLMMLGCGLRPSHANIHIAGFGTQVSVHGMVVSSNDVVHADEHGAVSFPTHLCEEIIRRALDFIETEKPIIDACKHDTLTFERLRELYLGRSS